MTNNKIDIDGVLLGLELLSAINTRMILNVYLHIRDGREVDDELPEDFAALIKQHSVKFSRLTNEARNEQ